LYLLAGFVPPRWPGLQPIIQEFRRLISDQTGQPNPVARCIHNRFYTQDPAGKSNAVNWSRFQRILKKVGFPRDVKRMGALKLDPANGRDPRPQMEASSIGAQRGSARGSQAFYPWEGTSCGKVQ
jgi:hypothetical protein